MGLLDDLFGQGDASAAPSPVMAASQPTTTPAVPADGSLLQRYLFAPMGLSNDTSEGLNTAIGAIGAGLLTGNRYNWIGPGFQEALKQGTKDAELRKQKNALRMILKQSNPSLSDAQIDVMANDPQTAKLAMSLAETQAQNAAGQRASASIAPFLGGGGGSGVTNLGWGAQTSPATPAGPAAGASLNGGGQIPGDLDASGIQGDTAIRTVLAEAGNQGPEGMKAVAGVLRNRALLAGTDLSTEALKPNQFEPWNPDSGNDPRRFKVDSPEYKAAAAAVLPVLTGQEPDPTGGATHFYSPKGQARLGRNAPAWDDGSGVDLGGHRFFRLPYAGKNPSALAQSGNGRTQVADATGNAPVDPVTRSDVPPIPAGASDLNPGRPVQVANNENETQALESRLGMLPPNVYGITRDAQAGPSQNGASPADMPAPNARPAEFRIPPASGTDGGPAYAPDSTTARAIAARQANAGNSGGQAAAGSAPSVAGFPLNDPATATKAIPILYRALSTNLPEGQRQQYSSLLTYALGVVKPTERTRSLMESGYTPGTPEYVQAYRNLVNADRTPSGYRYRGDGQTLEPIPGGPQDPANKRDKTPPAGYRLTDDGNGLEAIPGGPADPSVLTARAAATAAGKPPAAPKPLPHNAVKDLSEAGASYGDFTRLSGSFQPAYGGWKSAVVGDAVNSVARYTGIGNTDAADWWADYSAKRNVVRNKLFGAALTSQEKSEFEKADITPGMTPEAITKNLQRQTTAATAAARKMAGYYVKAGRSPDEIEAALGVGLDQLGLDPAGGTSSRSSGGQGAGQPSAPASAPTIAPAARFGQLTATGLSKEQAYARMRQEGY